MPVPTAPQGNQMLRMPSRKSREGETLGQKAQLLQQINGEKGGEKGKL